MRVGMCQLTSSEDPTENISLIRERAGQAAEQGARVVVFPEAMMARFGVALAPLAEPVDGPWARAVAAIADELGVGICAGMFTPSEDGRVRNSVLVTGLGEHTTYDKIHLYDAFGFRESDTVADGSTPVTIEVDGVVLGIATCYDVRFPELFQTLAESGSSAVVLPASWGAGPGKREQWEVLVRARALDSGNWVLGCGQADPSASGTPVHPKAPTGIGYSTVADPFGHVHAQLGAGEDVLLVDIDPALAQRSRDATAVLGNRKLTGRRS